MIDILRERHHLCGDFIKTRVAFVFLETRLEGLKSADLLKSILQQFVAGCSSIPRSVVEAYENHRPQRSHLRLIETSSILDDELRNLDHAYVLIEALDRGEKTTTTELLCELVKMQRKSGYRLKLLVSSPGTDEYSSILESFCEIKVWPHRAELEPYIKKRIVSSVQMSEWCDREESLRLDIIDAVCDKADGMYDQDRSGPISHRFVALTIAGSCWLNC